MTREEEIRKATLGFVSPGCQLCSIQGTCKDIGGYCIEQNSQEYRFVAGARWADQHPKNVWHDTIEENLVELKKQLQNGAYSEDVFYNGLAGVQIKDKYNVINTDGELLSKDLWFDWVSRFSEDFALVKLDDRGWNLIGTNGHLLRDDLWFDEIDYDSNGFAKVKLDGKWNKINKNGNLYNKDENIINNIIKTIRRVLRMIKIKWCTRV